MEMVLLRKNSQNRESLFFFEKKMGFSRKKPWISRIAKRVKSSLECVSKESFA